ncbi:MAG: LacI family transcriptional regulator [Ruminiclostridium sp.]|nr:LacI family transcriptional regulator [Ruminiclostridium sp.]
MRSGVSGATVSRVFNNPKLVGEKTREAVFKAAKELNYHPNLIASNFVKGVSGNIGVIIPYIPNIHIFSVYYFSELLSGIGKALDEYGYNLILFFCKADENGINDYSAYFKSGKVDGCVLLGTRRNDAGILSLTDMGYKFCLVNNYIEGRDISYIDVDNIMGSYMAVMHLISLGHRRIAFLNGPESYTNSIDRLTGYKKALEENNIPFDSQNVIIGNYGKKSGYISSSEILKLREKPSAIFAGNDRMAAGLVQGLTEKGLKIPGDISVAGYDDSDISTIVRPALTTVHIPFFEMGRRCISEFIKQVKGERSCSFKVLIKPELIIRESTANKSEIDTRGLS